jgi:5-methylcytosine-specific restriction protein A
MSFLRYNKKPPYYIRQAEESFFRYIRRVVKSMIRMYPHAKVHGIRYMCDTDFRRAISTKRKKAIRVQRKARLKTALIERDGERCLHCIKPLVREQLTIDHIFPLCMGGDNELKNLQLLCVPCHEEKTRNDHELYRIKKHYGLHYVLSLVATSSSSSGCKSGFFIQKFLTLE